MIFVWHAELGLGIDAWQARALVHVGSLNRKSRPTKSLGDPLCELMKNFKGLIQEIGQFCEYVSALVSAHTLWR
jgi:hypothetical protein